MNLKDTTISLMNNLGKKRTPFLFIIDFLCERPIVIPLSDIDPENILYNLNGITNIISSKVNSTPVNIHPHPEKFEDYNKKFLKVQEEIAYGNTYLLNLTCATPIDIDTSLYNIIHCSNAKYKLFLKDNFTCFSPESFIKIKQNKIYSFPMKGTIDGNIPNAEKIILNDKKEISEHYTIVDLIRNDLNSVSKNVKVDSFRYIDSIITQKGSILQVSSQISGDLDRDWHENIGNIIAKLIPAGSICGAPKEKTVEIIKNIENYDRSYYTGICGVFDGYSIESAVMIRFIEQNRHSFLYKSGGGITSYSNAEKEYNEIIQKIYVPII